MRNILFIGLLFTAASAFAQTNKNVFENRIFKNSIKTVLAYNAKQEQSFPIIQLGSGEEIIFEFDELGKSNSNYFYSVEHCNADWTASGVSRLDYLEGFSSERINDYKLSSNTIQAYTHYQLKLPNAQTKIKISGNFILKVFESGKQNTPIFTQRFYVISNQASLKLDLIPSAQVNRRNTHQKLDISLIHPFPIANPNMDVKAVVLQNFNPNTSKNFNKPNIVRNGTLIYNDIELNDFLSGAEFRKFDLRSLRFKGVNVQDIQRGLENVVALSSDDASARLRYTSQIDENGNFFIKNTDGRDSKIDADYARVHFRLKSEKLNSNGKAYVVGLFNNYRTDSESELTYNEELKSYQRSILVKQGLYDYQYVWIDAANPQDRMLFEGSFFETENTYQVFVYFKKPGARWEELIAFANLNSAKSGN